MIIGCPGSQKFRHPQPETVKCYNCGMEGVEIWTDEVEAICPGCKGTIRRQNGQSCLEWCKYARECVGDKIYETYIGNKNKRLCK